MRAPAVPARLLSLLLAVGVLVLAPTPAQAAAEVEVSTPTLSFGPATPGPGQETKSVDVTNTGTEDVVVGSPRVTGADRTSFWASETCGGGAGGSVELGPDEICTIEVTFAAAAAGPRTATLVVPTTAGPDLTVALSATTSTAGIALSDPGAFGPTTVGEPTTRVVTVTSTGELPLEVSGVTFSGTNANQFSVAGNDCAVAATASGGTCDITVRFLPTTAGAKTATLNVASNAGSPASVQLAGATGTPTLTAPASVSIPSTPVGATGAADVAVSSSGAGALEWNGAALSGANANQFELRDGCAVAELVGPEPCTVEVLFKPTNTGNKTATLTLKTVGQPDKAVAVSGTAVAATRVTSTSPASLSFDPQTIATSSAPQPVTITNTGNSQLIVSMDTFSVSPSGEFSAAYDCPSPLAPGEECAIDVLFRPTAVGTRNATLSIVSNGLTKTVPLTGTGTAASPVTVNPGVRQFAPTAVGNTTGTVNHTVTNNGAGPISLDPITLGGPAADQFTIPSTTCGPTLNAGASCSIGVRFAPTSMGLKAATIVVPTSVAGSPHSVALTGIATRGYPNPTPSSVDLGPAGVGTTTASRTVTVTNTGNGAMTVNAVSVTGADADDFQIAGNTCDGAALAKDATCTVDVRFAPDARGDASASLSITHNAGAARTVGLSGSGLGAEASIDTASLDFGSVRVNATSAPLAATVTNTGETALIVGAANLSGVDAGQFAVSANDCSGEALAPGASCVLSVRVTPTSRETKAATLTVAHDAGASAIVDLTATGTRATAAVSPASKNFGTQAVGTPSSAQPLTVTNTGPDPLELTGFGLVGGDPGSFDLTGSTCHGATLATGATCTLSVRFNPGSAGAKAALLTLTHNGTGTSAVALSGTGVAPVVSPSTTELAFGEVGMGSTSAPKTVTLTNTGSADLVVGATSVTGADADSFEVSANTCTGVPVAPNASCAVSVRFTAGDAGPATASLSIAHNAGDTSPTVIALTGTSTTTADIKILGIGSVYTGHDHLVTRTVKASGTQMKYKLGIVNEDTVAHTYKFRLTSSKAAATAQVWATGFPAQLLPTDGAGNFVTGTVAPGKTVLFELRVTPTAPGQVTSRVAVDLLSSEGDLIESVTTETNTAAPTNGTSGYELFVKQGSQPMTGGPVDEQTATAPALKVGQSTSFKLRLKNNNTTSTQIGLRLTRTDGCAGSFTVTVKAGSTVITLPAATGSYLTPTLQSGRYKDITVSIKRTAAGCRAVHLRAQSLDDGTVVRTSNLVTNTAYDATVD